MKLARCLLWPSVLLLDFLVPLLPLLLMVLILLEVDHNVPWCQRYEPCYLMKSLKTLCHIKSLVRTSIFKFQELSMLSIPK